jgi:hypothetical protein
LGKRVEGEAAGAFEPALVAGACEGFEECEAVARCAVAEAVAFLVAVGPGVPDELGAAEQEVLVEVVPGAGEDTRSAGAPLKTDQTIARARELRTRRAGPLGEAALAERMPGERTAAVSLASASSGSNRRRASVFPAAPDGVPRPR